MPHKDPKEFKRYQEEYRNKPENKKRKSELGKIRFRKPEIKSKHRNKELKRLYGIDLNEFNLILESQDYGCAICGTKEPLGRGSFHVDHCHETDRIRGLLCHHCNVALGSLKDDPDIVYKAWIYLCLDKGKVDYK